MGLETKTVKELIEDLSECPFDAKVYYSTRYALTPFNLRVIEDGKYVVIEMSDESKELIDNEY